VSSEVILFEAVPIQNLNFLDDGLLTVSGAVLAMRAGVPPSHSSPSGMVPLSDAVVEPRRMLETIAEDNDDVCLTIVLVSSELLRRSVEVIIDTSWETIFILLENASRFLVMKFPLRRAAA